MKVLGSTPPIKNDYYCRKIRVGTKVVENFSSISTVGGNKIMRKDDIGVLVHDVISREIVKII
jgi:hypothetical protein